MRVLKNLYQIDYKGEDLIDEKTKGVCTMGPNTNDRELLKKLIENGMDVARFNFSHGDHEEQKAEWIC